MDLNQVKTFISIGAHCDDVEYRTGGLFSRLVRQGARGVYVVMVENPWVGPGVEVADSATALAIRRSEARAGAAVLGAARVEFFAFKSFYLSTPDRRVLYPAFRDRAETEALAAEVHWYGLPPVANAYLFPECVTRLGGLIREEQPDLILTHMPNDRHPDHYEVSRFCDLVVNDMRRDEGLKTEMWLREPGSGGALGGWHPNLLVELSEADVARHQRAIDCFPSQFPKGMAGYARARAEAYGRLGGVRFAEPYAGSSRVGSGKWDCGDGRVEALALAGAPVQTFRL